MTEEVKKDEVVETTEEVTETAAPAVEEIKEEVKEEAPAATEEASSDEGEDVEVPAKFKDLVEAVDSMSVLDLHELVKLLEKKFGVSAAAVAVAGAGGAAGGDAGEEKSEFDVELTSAGDSKIGVIKAVKAALGLGLKEAKELVDGAPAVLKAGVKPEEAEEIKKAVEEAGGSVELK